MKKLLMFLCCVFAFGGAFAATNCPTTNRLELQGTQDGRDDEFIYTSDSVRQQVLDCYKNRKTDGKVCEISGGSVYECDKEHGCTIGYYMFGNSGWVRGDGKSVEDKIVACSTIPDVWNIYSYSDCPEEFGERYHKLIKIYGTDRECYSLPNGGNVSFCCYSLERSLCKKDPYGIWNGFNCQCANSDGVQREWNRTKEKCEPINGNVTPAKKSCGDIMSGHHGDVPCLKEQTTSGATRCGGWCEDGEIIERIIKECDTSKYEKDPKDGKCVKKQKTSSGQQTGRNNNNGDSGNVNIGGDNAVQLPPVVEQPFSCPELTPSDWRTLYKDCEDVIAALDELELYCVSSARTEEGYTTRYTKLQQLRRACEQKANDRKHRITESTGIISNASKRLDELMAGLKVTVWKNAEGNFNTARLASDSIAGVVLGTAGGLITSHLVKKGQVKAGFEDIQCTVGGQKVADWGDEFTVGIQ